MCEKCVEIDMKIEQYRRLAAYLNDAELKETTEKLIRELIEKKIDLHAVRDE